MVGYSRFNEFSTPIHQSHLNIDTYSRIGGGMYFVLGMSQGGCRVT